MALLIYFVLLLFLLYKSKSIAIFFVLLQILSLAGSFFIGHDFEIDTSFKVFNIGLTIVILTLIIAPWRKIKNISEIIFVNEIKLKQLTKFLVIISIVPFIVLLATTIIVSIYVDDVNIFKYAEGVSTEFYYNLPFNIRLFILSTYLYNFSYFLLPLHFYYLAKGNYRLSILCFILSLNILLYGLTYFSRSVIAQYSFLYFSFLIILYNTLSYKIKSYIKKSIIIFGILFSIYFISITYQRFSKDAMYAELIPSKSIIQDPVLYSYFDYLSQWYYNGMYVLNSYNFQIFSGQLSLEPVYTLLGQYNISPYSHQEYVSLRHQLWPLNWYTFNGLVAYTIFDFGYFISIIFSMAYYYAVIRLKPRNGQISLSNLFLLVLLIQLPIMAIFYSTVAQIVIPLLLYIPILFYLRTYIIRKKEREF